MTPTPSPVVRDGYAESRARDDLLDRHATLRSDLDELLDVARAAGWTVPSSTVDGLYDAVADLGSDLEEGP